MQCPICKSELSKDGSEIYDKNVVLRETMGIEISGECWCWECRGCEFNSPFSASRDELLGQLFAWIWDSIWIESG